MENKVLFGYELVKEDFFDPIDWSDDYYTSREIWITNISKAMYVYDGTMVNKFHYIRGMNKYMTTYENSVVYAIEYKFTSKDKEILELLLNNKEYLNDVLVDVLENITDYDLLVDTKIRYIESFVLPFTNINYTIKIGNKKYDIHIGDVDFDKIDIPFNNSVIFEGDFNIIKLENGNLIIEPITDKLVMKMNKDGDEKITTVYNNKDYESYLEVIKSSMKEIDNWINKELKGYDKYVEFLKAILSAYTAEAKYKGNEIKSIQELIRLEGEDIKLNKDFISFLKSMLV